VKSERWMTLMAALGFNHNEAVFQSLIAAYAQEHRHYHTAMHIDACLRQLDRCAQQAERPAEIEIALWFHDAIYRPLSGDNERKSAAWASRFMIENSATHEAAARVHELIMVTRHNIETKTRDQALLVDIDLSILGTDEETYFRFEEAVRREYRLVPSPLYRRKRVEILNSFLLRPAIYQNEPFRSELEPQAKTNLANAIGRLSAHA
jgi:predicted metal-dependent HD superfamily phosphohydrolase